jgi:hypothetical protein
MMNNNTNVNNNGVQINNKGEMNMKNDLVKQYEDTLKEVMERGINPTLVSGVKKVFRCYMEGSRTEQDLVLAISALKLGERSATLNTPDLLMTFVKLLKAKEYITILNIDAKRNKYGKYVGSISCTPSPIGRAYSKHTKEESILVPVGEAGFTTITENSFAPFTKDFISITIEDKDDLKIAKDTGVYVLYADRETKAFVFKNGNLWVDIQNNKPYTELEIKTMAEEIEGADLRLCKAFVYSPSDVRNFSYACMDVTKEDNRDEYLNDISNGAWEIVKQTVEKMVADGKSAEKIQLYILKTMPRFGQLKAGSVNLGAIKSWAYYRKAFETACGETVDGTGYLRASYIAGIFSKILGITVTQSAVTGMFLQARPDLQKAAYEVLPDTIFDAIAEGLSQETDKDGKKLMTYEGSAKNKMKPVMIVDSNVVKVESNYRIKDLELELLEIAACSPANLSKQAFEKPLYADKEAALNYVHDLGQEYMMDTLSRQFLEPKAKIPTIAEVKKCYAPDLTLTIAPQMIRQSKPLFRANLNNTIRSCVNSIDKLRYPIAGNNVRLTSDAAELVVHKKGREFAAIKYGEIYMPAAVEHFRRVYKAEAIAKADEKGLTDEAKRKFVFAYIDKKVNNTKICMIKYPSMGPKEYYLARVLTLKTINARINNMALTDEEKALLKEYYKATGKSVAKLPAVKLVMFQCAGLDYDYDGAEFIYDQRYVGILDNPNYKNEATLIAEMDQIKAEYELIQDEVAVALEK